MFSGRSARLTKGFLDEVWMSFLARGSSSEDPSFAELTSEFSSRSTAISGASISSSLEEEFLSGTEAVLSGEWASSFSGLDRLSLCPISSGSR